jgi:hypothetical protein
MIDVRLVAVASLTFVLGGQALAAQAPFEYRQYALESSVAAVIKVSRPRDNDPRTLHERPASIQEVVWRAPYMGLGGERPDPVHEVLFNFYDDQLYRIVVTYDRGRMAGLINDDVVQTLSATYGVPLLPDARTARNALPLEVGTDMGVVAQWENARSVVTLLRSTHSSPHFQLVLISKTLNPLARAAIIEARRLDALDAPQRERDRRTQAVAEADATAEKTRAVNKTAFRP